MFKCCFLLEVARLLPDAKRQLSGKDIDAEKEWEQEQKEATEYEMVGWHHWHNGREFEQTLGDSEGQGSLACCSPRGGKESDTTEWLKNNKTASYVEMKRHNILLNEWFLVSDLHSELNNQRKKISHLRVHFWNPVFSFFFLSLRHPTFHCFAICMVKYTQTHWLEFFERRKNVSWNSF